MKCWFLSITRSPASSSSSALHSDNKRRQIRPSVASAAESTHLHEDRLAVLGVKLLADLHLNFNLQQNGRQSTARRLAGDHQPGNHRKSNDLRMRMQERSPCRASVVLEQHDLRTNTVGGEGTEKKEELRYMLHEAVFVPGTSILSKLSATVTTQERSLQICAAFHPRSHHEIQ